MVDGQYVKGLRLYEAAGETVLEGQRLQMLVWLMTRDGESRQMCGEDRCRDVPSSCMGRHQRKQCTLGNDVFPSSGLAEVAWQRICLQYVSVSKIELECNIIG